VLLLHPSGKAGWWVRDDSRIVEYAATFAEFCERYAEFRRLAWKAVGSMPWKSPGPKGKLVAWPFDFYSSTNLAEGFLM
jgi:hypothetical protein